MNPLDALVLELATARAEPVMAESVALLFSRGQELPREEFLALVTVAGGALERLHEAGKLVLDGKGWYRAPGQN
jgi:hypothetical protein